MAQYSDHLNVVQSDLFKAFQWLEEARNARMTERTKLGHLLAEFGGSYRRAEPEQLAIAGVKVSCTGGLHNLLNAWSAKALRKLNGENV